MTFKVWIPQGRGRPSLLLRLNQGDSAIMPHKTLQDLLRLLDQFTKAHPKYKFEYLECINGFVVKRTR